MKKSRFTEQQIAFALRQGENGTRVEEICRQMGISQTTYFSWKKKYGSLGVAEVRRLKQLEEEKKKLRQLVADLSLDKEMLQGSRRRVRLPKESSGAGSEAYIGDAS